MGTPDFLQIGIDAISNALRLRQRRAARWVERRLDALREGAGNLAAPLPLATKTDVARIDRRLRRTDSRVRHIEESRPRG